ncbi:thiamine-monophosphate kinase [Cohnella kolymensis]|uniref:Thiamine-monophosphate kinase n=1 Tax=Cohnella kolymensis TaxID=1590652 RepID=A0ABR5A516_9BACL|nr:thiamine-monophosphate kinase [Cohnella kolymensis]
MDEFGLIRVWTEDRQSKEFLQGSGVILGIGDDTAIVQGASGQEWLLAMDTMVEEVHFLSDTMCEEDIGYKALASNISDIAAMGGVPKFALVSVSIPPNWNEQRMKKVYDGLYECAAQYEVAVVGGDTTAAPRHLVVSVTVMGTVEAGRALRRSDAGPGQFVFLTGATGLSAAGLHGLLPKPEGSRSPRPPQRLIKAHQRPSPSVKAGRLLVEQGWGSALNDISDGLASEAWEIAEASSVRLILKEAQLPLSGELAAYAHRCRINPLDWVLYGGEDYVLLGTADHRHEAAMKEQFRAEGIPLFIIGEVEQGAPEVLLEASSGRRQQILKQGYNHFSKG